MGERPAEIELELPAYAAAVLDVVDEIPAGRVTTYGAIARRLGTGGPRQVAGVLSRYGSFVAWWRVVDARGALPPRLLARALPQWTAEGTPLLGSGAHVRVDVRSAGLRPDR